MNKKRPRDAKTQRDENPHPHTSVRRDPSPPAVVFSDVVFGRAVVFSDGIFGPREIRPPAPAYA